MRARDKILSIHLPSIDLKYGKYLLKAVFKCFETLRCIVPHAKAIGLRSSEGEFRFTNTALNLLPFSLSLPLSLSISVGLLSLTLPLPLYLKFKILLNYFTYANTQKNTDKKYLEMNCRRKYCTSFCNMIR